VVRRVRRGAWSEGERGNDVPDPRPARFDAKKKSFVATESLRPAIQHARAEFVEAMMCGEIPATDLVVLDESGSNRSMTSAYGRAPRGERARGHKPKSPGENVSILSAITLEGVVATVVHEGAIDGERFLAYLKEQLLPRLRPGQVLVMDNLRVHHMAPAIEAIEAAGVVPLFLPSYSPDLSPIEHAWSKLKAFLRRRGARTLADLRAAIAEGLATISGSDCVGWFRHCGWELG